VIYVKHSNHIYLACHFRTYGVPHWTSHWCRRRGWKRIPKSFDLVTFPAQFCKMGAKSLKTFTYSLKIWAKFLEIWKKWRPTCC